LSTIWADPQIIHWTQILLDSYRQLIGSELIERDRFSSRDAAQTLIKQAQLLYTAPFVVVSHDTQSDPVLNYGNQVALDLWEMDWQTLTQTRSRNTAEPMNQTTRQEMLARAHNQGFISDYQGVRISSSGRRFLIDRATIWNLIDAAGQPCGQAATFATWKYLET
jgi:uncharacterized membrane protein